MKMFTVWVGAVEVNSSLMAETEAKALAAQWLADGYDDVIIQEVNEDYTSHPTN